jgi:hypothetical protein
MKNIILIATCSLFCILNNCKKEKAHITIGFTNNTERRLDIFDSYTYPDTSITLDIFRGVYIVKPFSREPLNNEWKKEIDSESKSGVVMLFVFDSDTLSKYGEEGVIDGYKVLKRYDLTLQVLDNLNWELTYP